MVSVKLGRAAGKVNGFLSLVKEESISETNQLITAAANAVVEIIRIQAED